MFGLNRSLSKTHHSIRTNILKELDDNNVNFTIYANFIETSLIHNERSGEIKTQPEQSPETFLKFEKISYSDQSSIDQSINWNKVFEFGDTYNQIDTSNTSSPNSTTKNIFRSLYCLKASFELIDKNKLSSPTLFIRPDTEFQNKLDVDLLFRLLEVKPKNFAFGKTDGVALTPNWHCWSGVNDRFAVCTSGSASIAYAKRFDHLLNYIHASKKPIHPETYLLHTLQQARTQILPIINTLVSRIRSTGNAYPEDYSKGGTSLDFQAETINILSKTIKEQDKQIQDLKEKQKDFSQKKLIKSDQAKNSDLDKEFQEISSSLSSLNTTMINWDQLKACQRTRNLTSVIVLNFNKADLTIKCLNSILKSKNKSAYEIICIDNGSEPAQKSQLRNFCKQHNRTQFISNESNFHFALGCNLGFAQAKGDNVIFLNNDTLVSDFWIDQLSQSLQQSDSVLAVQPKLIYPDNTIQSIGTVFAKNQSIGYPIYQKLPCYISNIVREHSRFQAITAACMAIRAKDFADAYGFDCSFINGQEDVDLCLRIRTKSDQYCLVNHQCTVVHFESKTPGRWKFLKQNRILFRKKWKGKIAADDFKYYKKDNLKITGHQVEPQEFKDLQVATHKPILQSKKNLFPTFK